MDERLVRRRMVLAPVSGSMGPRPVAHPLFAWWGETVGSPAMKARIERP